MDINQVPASQTAAETKDAVGSVWKEGDILMFGTYGVCRITGTQVERDGTQEFVLQPLFDGRSRVLVPLDSTVLLSKMKPVLTRTEVDAFIDDIPDHKLMWVDKPNARKEVYHAVLRRGDRVELSRVIKTLRLEQDKMEARGKHLYRSDEQVLHDAKRILYEEFAYAIGIEPSEVEGYISQKLSA